MRNLGSTASLETENRNRYPERIAAVAEKLKTVDASTFASFIEKRPMSSLVSATSSATATASIAEGGSSVVASGEGTGTGHAQSSSRQGQEIKNACDGVVDFAVEQIHEGITQAAKTNIFS
jgi:hypothetical protein